MVGPLARGQQNTLNGASVPPVVRFSGSVKPTQARSLPGSIRVTFGLYQEEVGGEPLWTETQAVKCDAQGRYAVFLGAASPEGIPLELFTSSESRWIGVTPEGADEGPRTAILSVPYALKASDADTLSGKRAEEFVSTATLKQLLTSTGTESINKANPNFILGCFTFPSGQPCGIQTPPPAVAPSFVATNTVGPSFMSQATSGPPFQILSTDLVTNLNSDRLQGMSAADFALVKGANSFSSPQIFNAPVTFGSIGGSTTSQNGLFSAPANWQITGIGGDGLQHSKTFSVQAEQSGAITTSSSGHLNLLYTNDNGSPTETGLAINFDGTITFAPGQIFPAAAILAAINGQSTGLAPGTTGSTSNDPALQPVVYSDPYSWNQSPAGTSIQAGLNTVALSPCPPGVSGTDVDHFLYISGTGTPEIIVISGGTCFPRAASGTIQFQAAGPHPPGFIISSATSGIQEAVNDAAVPSGNGTATRPVLINPGEHVILGRISMRTSNLNVSGFGATLTCAMSDSCVLLGDRSRASMFTRITLNGLQFRPGVVGGTYPAVEDNANGSQMTGIAPVAPLNGGTFGYLLQIDNDQAAYMSRIDTNGVGSAFRCDAQFCGAAIYAPGPFSKWAAVGQLMASDLSMQCGTNGVDWQSGNTLTISNDTVIQGYPQYGVRAGLARGGYGNETLDSVYEEAGCPNPLGNVGSTGLMIQGSKVHWTGGEGPSGTIPSFASGGASEFYYWIVPHHAQYGPGVPLLAGNSLPSGTESSITVTIDDIPGASSFDLLRTSQATDGYDAPSGTGNWAVVLNVPRASVCSNQICILTDPLTPTQSYTVADPTYFPFLKLWPGPIVLGSAEDATGIGGALAPAQLYTDEDTASVLSVAGSAAPTVFAQSCEANMEGSPILKVCGGGAYPSTIDYAGQAVLMLNKPNNDGGLLTNLKGKLNFGTSGTGPNHIITLMDSNFDKTVADRDNRPSNDPNDSFIGQDTQDTELATRFGMSLGAPKSISLYIGNNGDGVNWKERLTASLKEFNTNVQIDGSLVVKGGCEGCNATPAAQQLVSGGTVSVAPKGTSEVAFDERGRLAVSENGGPVREVAKKTSQQFDYQVALPDVAKAAHVQELRSVFINRVGLERLEEVYCEVDAGTARINLTSDGKSVLASDLLCTEAGSSTSRFSSKTFEIALGQKLSHRTTASDGAHRVIVILKYVGN